VLSSRVVSDDPKQVVAYAREFLRGLGDAGVLGCGKHFPGLGEAALDTHHELPIVEKPLRKLWNEDLVPYRSLSLRRELPFIMVSHAAFPAVTKDRTPASLSKKWITGILRKKIGYRGLICSDDLEMGGVLAAAPIEQAIIEHIRAGGDLGLICHREDFILRAHEALVREAERDGRFARRVRESVGRVLAFKKKLFIRKSAASRRTSVPTSARVEKLRRQLWEFSEEIRLATLARAESRKERV
jgi:beta-N-acetylhexosaminidase